jgi:hypothetical protein
MECLSRSLATWLTSRPVSVLFATFLGYNPLQHLLGAHVLGQLPAASARTIIGREFFPGLIAAPFRSGLHEVFTFSIVICLIAAAASWSRGGHYVDDSDLPAPALVPPAATPSAATAS